MILTEKMTSEKIQCKISQRDRLFRVFTLAKVYCDFRDIYLKECILKSKNDYKEAEKFSGLMNSIFGTDSTPSSFITDYEKTTNELIDNVSNFKSLLKSLEGNSIGLNEKCIIAFCNNVEHGSFHLLKINNCFKYQTNWLLNYYLNYVGKDAFLEGFKETDIFSKSKKYNNIEYKRTFLAIEKTYYEILRKQIFRNLKIKKE